MLVVYFCLKKKTTTRVGDTLTVYTIIAMKDFMILRIQPVQIRYIKFVFARFIA